jgi:hypothetical protein
LNRELAVSALPRALTSRKPPLALFHYTRSRIAIASHEYRFVLNLYGVACSMSAAGNCYDNAVAASFFATLKKELVHGCAFETRSEANDAISDYIENHYNAKRRPSAAGNQSPINFGSNSGRLVAQSHQQSVQISGGSPACSRVDSVEPCWLDPASGRGYSYGCRRDVRNCGSCPPCGA